MRRRELLRGASLAPLAFALPAPGRTASASRGEQAYRVRLAAAQGAREAVVSKDNDDERELPYVAMYSKGLPHNALGEVDPRAYELLLRAMRSGDPQDFDRIPCAGPVKLTNPQAGLSYNLVGPDPSAIACPPPPRFSSLEQAAEMAELYWQAETRDVPFAEYNSNLLIRRAAQELGRLRGVSTTPQNVFRGSDAGSLAGPYISQFLWREVPMPPLPGVPKFHSAAAGRDYAGDAETWRGLQNGVAGGAMAMDATRRYLRNGRDLAEYVHRDFSFQVPLCAALILLKLGAPPSASNPYARSHAQVGFVTFGAPHLMSLLGTVAHAALTACWYQKWMVHRRLRPEEMGGRVANHIARRASYPIHEALLGSEALATTLKTRASALLTSSYPEHAPTHPAYPAGHSVLAGAGVTVLKAFFDETFVMRDPLVSNPDGLSLKPYDGPPLTLRGELDKLAFNIGMGRCFAGIHWRSDIEEGLRLGEEVAIRVLREVRLTAHEPFSGFRLHRFDGGVVEV